MYGTGIDRVGEICDLAVNLGIINKSGSWFSYGEQRFQGRDKLKELIKTDEAFAQEIESKVLDSMKNSEAEDEADAPAPASAVEARPVTQERAAAKAKLDIAIDDDED